MFESPSAQSAISLTSCIVESSFFQASRLPGSSKDGEKSGNKQKRVSLDPGKKEAVADGIAPKNKSDLMNADASVSAQNDDSLSLEEIKEVNSSCSKMQHLSVRRLSDDEFSEADSMIR